MKPVSNSRQFSVFRYFLAPTYPQYNCQHVRFNLSNGSFYAAIFIKLISNIDTLNFPPPLTSLKKEKKSAQKMLTLCMTRWSLLYGRPWHTHVAIRNGKYKLSILFRLKLHVNMFKQVTPVFRQIYKSALQYSGTCSIFFLTAKGDIHCNLLIYILIFIIF